MKLRPKPDPLGFERLSACGYEVGSSPVTATFTVCRESEREHLLDEKNKTSDLYLLQHIHEHEIYPSSPERSKFFIQKPAYRLKAKSSLPLSKIEPGGWTMCDYIMDAGKIVEHRPSEMHMALIALLHFRSIIEGDIGSDVKIQKERPQPA